MNNYRARLTLLSVLSSIAIASLLPDAVANTVVIFDGSSDSAVKEASTRQSRTVAAAVTPGAKRAWAEKESDFKITAQCKGSFTRAGANQVAFLYSWCETGRQVGIAGLAVMENGRLVAHFGWEGGGEYDIVRLPDLDGNGPDELAIAAGGTGQGYANSNIAILGLRAGALKKFGRFQIYSDNSGAVEKNAETIAWKVSADVPASKLVFQQQKLKKVTSAWVKSGKLTKVTPEKDEAIYKKL